MEKERFLEYSSISQWVEVSVLQFGNENAIWFEGRFISYTEMNAAANKLSRFIKHNFNVENGFVGICLDRSPELLISILAVLKCGAAYVPFDAAYPAERLEFMATTAAIPLILTSGNLESKLPKGEYQKINIDQLALQEFSNENLGLPISPNTAAYVLFTSGSTGNPKGVVMPQKALLNLIDFQIKQTTVHQQGKTLQFAPVSFDVHFQEIFSTWCDGGCIYLINDEQRLNAPLLINFLSENKINRLFLPFIALQNICEMSSSVNVDLSSLSEIITAGEQLQITPAVIRFFEKVPSCVLYNHYGPTESHVVTSFKLEGAPSTWNALPPIGQPIQNCEVLLLDEHFSPVAKGAEGELYLKGVCLADGYLNRVDLTAERFIQNPKNPNERIYKTGDLAMELPDGNIQYLGRIDGQVKVRGYRIELGEIEVVLSKIKSIVQVAATVREDKPGEKKLVAYYVLNNDEKLSVKDIRNFLQGHLPDYMMPSAFVQLNDLPRTPSGKIDRKRLPKPDTKRPALGIPFTAPTNELEEKLASLWSDILNIDQVGIHDNFFDLGGNSLLALQFIARLYNVAGIKVSVVKAYQYPTIAGLSQSLSGGEKESLKERMLIRAAGRSKKDNTDDSIAIIGMSLRVPGAETPEAFWNLLKEGKETITFFKDEELDTAISFEERNDPNYVKARGIIKDAAGFDAAFFNINPNIAKVTDPQQRILLEISWNALEHSGYSPDRYNGLIGVFAGSGNNTYYLNNVLSNPEMVKRVGSFITMTQNEKDYIATRIAYELNLKGLAVSIHTGCSTSLTAIVQACENLLNRQCDMALAGGIAITSPVNSGQRYEEGAMFSNDGHTRTFDAAARGTVFSDGAGMVVLKRYEDALKDGDNVYALIRGAALNNDGGDKGSFTAPSVDGQASVIGMAHAIANIDPSTISYVETHGTATPVGDPIEIEGLTKAFREYTDKNQFCAVGSVKSNFGHLTAAAGVAGLIKTTLSLYNKQIPASLHYKEPNPQIPFATSPFYVNDKFSEWNTDLLPRRAGVSSFGVGGTNAHVVIEEAPLRKPSGTSRPKQLILLSAKTETALTKRVAELSDYLQKNKEVPLADIAYTLQTGRTHFNYGYLASIASHEDAITVLTQGDPKRSSKHQLQQKANDVVFMFPGQGSQYVGMGSNLYRDELVFKESVDECAKYLNPLLGCDLREILFASEGNIEAEKLLKQTYYTQPALFTIGYSLAQLWMSWGIKPAALIGHSIGEFVAATIAGVFSLEDALTAIANRSKLMQALPSGGMLSVRLSASEVEKYLTPEVSIAAINGPQLCVVAGPYEALELLQQQWEQKEIMCKLLHTSHAFHSPMMEPIVEPFETIIKSLKLNKPSIPILSTITTNWMKDEEACDPHYWAHHLRATVKFADGVKALWNDKPNYVLIELGPRNTATTLARQQSIDLKTQRAIASLGESANDDAEWTAILAAIGQLWLSGIEIDWKAFYSYENRNRIALPTYPFEHQQLWLAINKNTPPSFKEEKLNTTIEQNFIQNSPIEMSNRKETIISEIKEILEEASGIEMENAASDASFIELGLDSLFLTSVALTITKKYGVKTTFRQLNEELSTLDALSKFIDVQLPAEAPQAIEQIPVSQPTSPAPTNNVISQNNFIPPVTPIAMQHTGNTNLQWLISQQMQLMQQQLMLIQGQSIVASPSIATPVQQTELAISKAPLEVTKEISGDELKELKKPFGAVARIEKKTTEQFTPKQQRWLEVFTAAFNEKSKKSKLYTQEHRSHLADPRVVTGFKPHLKEMIYQPVVNKSLGSRVWDIDGNEYIDILNGFGSNMFGHNPDFIVKAIAEQLQNGYELGPQHELAGPVAKMICELTGSDRAGFCNTGSEAVLGAMRIARTVTGRSLIVSFNGAYHGINDEVILRGSKKLKSVPAAAGIMPEAVSNMLVLDYGTPEALAIINSRADEIAAVLVEPVQSRRADFQPKEFLQELRNITTRCGALLIFDEVITGFRISPGGAQQYFGIKADIGTYGKIVGGGMPIGVIAGKREYMDALDGGFWQYGDNSVPEIGVTYFAGTFVRHPFALAAAKASLMHMIEKGETLQNNLTSLTKYLVTEINDYFAKLGAPIHLVNFGSLFKPKYDADIPNADLLYLLLRFKGIHVYDGFPCFLTEAHTKIDVDRIISSFKEAIRELIENGFIPGNIPSDEVIPSYKNGSTNGKEEEPPMEGALKGKNPDGTPGWFLPDPDRPGKYLKINQN